MAYMNSKLDRASDVGETDSKCASAARLFYQSQRVQCDGQVAAMGELNQKFAARWSLRVSVSLEPRSGTSRIAFISLEQSAGGDKQLVLRSDGNVAAFFHMHSLEVFRWHDFTSDQISWTVKVIARDEDPKGERPFFLSFFSLDDWKRFAHHTGYDLHLLQRAGPPRLFSATTAAGKIIQEAFCSVPSRAGPVRLFSSYRPHPFSNPEIVGLRRVDQGN